MTYLLREESAASHLVPLLLRKEVSLGSTVWLTLGRVFVLGVNIVLHLVTLHTTFVYQKQIDFICNLVTTTRN